MRRAPALILVATLAALLLGPPGMPGPGPGIGADSAAAAPCFWQRHVKRVVKRVKRHGKVRRVVRRKVSWTCVPLAIAPPAPTPTPVPPALPPPDSEPEPEPEANRLSVKAAEFYFVLSRPSVEPGEVTVELNNRGEDPHNLNLLLEGGDGEALVLPETDSEERSVETFDLPAGKYKLWCSLPEHEEQGMTATLQVG